MVITATTDIARPADTDWALPVPATGNWWAWRINHPANRLKGLHKGSKTETQEIVAKHILRLDGIYVGDRRKLRFQVKSAKGKRLQNTWLGDAHRQTRAA